MSGSRRSQWGLLPVDLLLLAYIAVVSAIILLRWSAIPRPGALLISYLAVGGGILLAARFARRLPAGREALFRVASLFIIIPILFLLLGGIVSHANPHHAEIALKRIDDFLFLGQNPNLLLDRLKSPLLTEYLQIIYATYYFLPLVLLVGLLRRRNYRGVEETTLAVVACLLISYLGYFLVPATAPSMNIHHLYPWPPYEEEMRSEESSLPGIALAVPLRRLTFQAETIKHDCFPSGHTAMSLVVLLLARRHARAVYRLLAIPVASLIFSTMYLRYHYVIDVIAGVAVAILTLKLCPWLERTFGRAGDGPGGAGGEA